MYRKIGLIREGKVPVDRRVALTPLQCKDIEERYPDLDITVQSSAHRAYSDAEYRDAGIQVVEDLSDRDLIIGVKEVPIDMLIPGMSYLFFSHTIKKQEHNRKLLRAILDKKITLLDHELLTNDAGVRVIAFGRWAGIVGAYNAFRAWQATHKGAPLKPAHECHDRQEMEAQLVKAKLPKNLRIVMSGEGRVGKGAVEVLEKAGFQRLSPVNYLNGLVKGRVFTMLGSADLYARADAAPFDRNAFHQDPSGHRAIFLPYVQRSDVYIACHFWDPRGPKILTTEDLLDPLRRLSVVADISCDVNGPIDSTVRASTIAEPLYGYCAATNSECPVGSPESVTVMAVDNLPCELPRDSSEAFGNDLISKVLPEFARAGTSEMLGRATISSAGRLTPQHNYLKNWVEN